MINFILIPYLMLSCFLTGMHFEEYFKDGRKHGVYAVVLSTLIVLLIAPLLYFLDFLVDIFKNK